MPVHQNELKKRQNMRPTIFHFETFISWGGSAILVVKCRPPMKGSLSLEKLAEGTLYKGRIDGPRPPTTHDENQSPKSGLKDSFRSFCEFSNICWNGTRKLRADGDCQSKKLTRMVESSTTSQTFLSRPQLKVLMKHFAYIHSSCCRKFRLVLHKTFKQTELVT